MPITAKLSRRFYDKFWDEIVNELVGLRGEIGLLRSDLRAEMQAFKAEMIKWMFLFWIGTLLGGYLIK